MVAVLDNLGSNGSWWKMKDNEWWTCLTTSWTSWRWTWCSITLSYSGTFGLVLLSAKQIPELVGLLGYIHVFQEFFIFVFLWYMQPLDTDTKFLWCYCVLLISSVNSYYFDIIYVYCNIPSVSKYQSERVSLFMINKTSTR